MVSNYSEANAMYPTFVFNYLIWQSCVTMKGLGRSPDCPSPGYISQTNFETNNWVPDKGNNAILLDPYFSYIFYAHEPFPVPPHILIQTTFVLINRNGEAITSPLPVNWLLQNDAQQIDENTQAQYQVTKHTSGGKE
jgi:hypothetical protein